MRIGFHIAQLGGGGAERVLVLLANYFSAKGHQVYVVANIKCEDEYRIDPAVDKRYIEKCTNTETSLIKRNVNRVKFIRNLCKNEEIDCMVSFMAEPNIRTLIACLGLKTKNIISVRNDPKKEYPGKMLLLARCLFRLADCAVFQTTDAFKVFKGLGARGTVIPNPVDEVFYNVEWSVNSTRIVTAGRLDKQKNQELLIRAFAEMCNVVPAVTLDIFGTGPLRNNLMRVTEDCGVGGRVVFHGRTGNMPLELSDASIFVMSSDYEGMPNALMEAMAAGVPSISTDCPCGGPADLIDDRVNGILVPVDSVHELSVAMRDLLSDKGLRAKISYKSKESMRCYMTEKICKRWEEAVSGCVAR